MRSTFHHCRSLAVLAAIIGASPAVAQDPHRNLAVEAPRPAHPMRPSAGLLNVSLMPTASVVAIGTPLAVRVMATRQAYGHLYLLSASGKTQLLMENVPLVANRAVSFPTRDLVLRAAAPAGDETVIFVASREPIQGFAGRGITRTPMQLQQTHQGLRVALERMLQNAGRADYALAETVIRVQ
jgi:uncharacterized protein DUF4384